MTLWTVRSVTTVKAKPPVASVPVKLLMSQLWLLRAASIMPVPAPELASRKTSLPIVGGDAPVDPPDVNDQQPLSVAIEELAQARSVKTRYRGKLPTVTSITGSLPSIVKTMNPLPSAVVFWKKTVFFIIVASAPAAFPPMVDVTVVVRLLDV